MYTFFLHSLIHTDVCNMSLQEIITFTYQIYSCSIENWNLQNNSHISVAADIWTIVTATIRSKSNVHDALGNRRLWKVNRFASGKWVKTYCNPDWERNWNKWKEITYMQLYGIIEKIIVIRSIYLFLSCLKSDFETVTNIGLSQFGFCWGSISLSS